MTRFRRFGSLAMLLSFLHAGPARADAGDPRRVMLQTSTPSSSTARRLAAELAEHGVEVVVVPPAPGDVDPLGPKGGARDQRAIGVILLRSDDSSAVVWVRHADTGEVTVREIVPEPGSRSSVDDTIAIGAREVVRAALIQVPNVPETNSELTLPQVDKQDSPRFPRAGIATGFGAALGGADLGAVPQVSLDVRLLATRWLGVRAMTSVGLGDSSVGDGVSSADVNTWLLAGGITLGEAWFSGPLRPSAGVGLLGARVQATGRTPLAAPTRTEVSWVLAPYGAAGLSLRLSEALAIRADGLVAVAPKAPNIRLNGKAVARWGVPTLVASLSLEMALGR